MPHLQLLAAAIAAAAATASAPGAAWLLTCDLGDAGSEPSVFRLAPGSLQRWKPVESAFGPNLCGPYECAVDRDRVEARISSTTVVYVIQLDRATQTGTWRVIGASNSRRQNGACKVERERPSAAAARPRGR
jgi:hypothetical protein